MKILTKVLLLMAVVATLIVGGAASVYAAGPATTLDVKGNITAVDSAAKPPTVTITPLEGNPVTVKIIENTIINKSGIGKAALSDLAVGDRVSATYNKDNMEAIRIVAAYPLAKHHAYIGTIKTIAADSFVLTTRKNVDVTLLVNGDTKYKVPGVKDAQLTNFQVGSKVAVLAVEAKEGNVARHMILIPGKPAIEQRDGIVSAYTAANGDVNGNITLKNKKGDEATFTVTKDTKIIFKKDATEIKVGERATVTANRDPATNQYIAKSILVFAEKAAK